MLRYFLLLSAIVSQSAWSGDEVSGRLFTTAAERAQLDQKRLQKILHPQADLTATPVLESVTLDGFVTRSSGKNTTWINQTEQNEAGHGNHLQVTQLPGHAAAISLQSANGKRVRLKVGETLDLNSGTVRKVYERHADEPAAAE